MNITNYYKHQANARGMFGVADIIDTLAIKKGMYNRVILPSMPRSKTAKIFELGCGAGIFQKWCFEHGYTNVTGSDFSEQQVDLARSLGVNVKLSNSLMDLAAFEKESLDCIVALDFYEHLKKEDFLDLLVESYRSLRIGGLLILRGPNGDSPVWGRAYCNDITHHFTLSTTAISALVKIAGFSRVSFYDDAIPSIDKNRFIRVPLAFAAQCILRCLIRLATRERIECLSASIFSIAVK